VDAEGFARLPSRGSFRLERRVVGSARTEAIARAHRIDGAARERERVDLAAVRGRLEHPNTLDAALAKVQTGRRAGPVA